MSPAKATLQACGGIYSQLEDRFIMLIFQPQHILKRMLLNSFSTLLNPAMLYSCLLLDLCSETWRGNAVWSPSNTKHIFYHNKCSCIIKTNVALVKVFELLLKGGGDWGGVWWCAISLFPLDELIELSTARGSVELYQWRPAVLLHLSNFTEPRASS